MDNMMESGMETLTSMEVAEMVEKTHAALLKDIRRYIRQFTEVNIDFSEFWAESAYKDSTGRSLTCYLVTKKGCEFIAHKLTGQKGTAFTARYINRFHEMEGKLVSGIGNKISAEEKEILQKIVEGQQEFMEQQMAVNRVQTEFNQMVMEFMRDRDKIQKVSTSSGMNPFNPGSDAAKNRLHQLNELTDRVAEMYDMGRNKVLHYLYQTIEEDMNINLKSYLDVFRSENRDENASTIHVICSMEGLFEKAVELANDAICRKKMFG